MENPLITVSMGAYNRENMIGDAIESVLVQTYTNFELLIVDNGSIDRSGQIAEKYAAKDKRIRVVHVTPNQGPAMRYDMGIQLAKGEFLTFVDDDDIVTPDFLEFMYGLIQESDSDISICACPDRGATGEKLIMTGEEAVIEMFERKKYNTRPSAKLYRTKIMESIRFPFDLIHCDAATTYKFLAKGNKVAFHGLIKYMYNQHDNNTVTWVRDHSKLTPKILDEETAIHRERTEWLSKRFPEQADHFLYYELSFDISMVEKIHRYQLAACQPQLEVFVKKLQKYQNVFMTSKWLKDFEKEWMEQYVL